MGEQAANRQDKEHRPLEWFVFGSGIIAKPCFSLQKDLRTCHPIALIAAKTAEDNRHS